MGYWPPSKSNPSSPKFFSPPPARFFLKFLTPPLPHRLPPLPQVGGGACPESSMKTKSFTTKVCPVGLFPRIICQEVPPLLPQMSQNCCPTRCGLFPLPLNLYRFIGNYGDGEKSYPTAKNLPIFLNRKIPLNRFNCFAIKSFISSSSNSNFQVITICNSHL